MLKENVDGGVRPWSMQNVYADYVRMQIKHKLKLLNCLGLRSSIIQPMSLGKDLSL